MSHRQAALPSWSLTTRMGVVSQGRLKYGTMNVLAATRGYTHLPVTIQSPWACKPLDRMCVHAGDGQTYLVRVDSMS